MACIYYPILYIMNIKNLFNQLLTGHDLSPKAMQDTMRACMSGELSDSEIAVFLSLLSAKGETVEELSAAAETILQFAKPIDLGDNLLDMVGTGGDGRNTFNVSTAASFVIAGAGIKVAKHGNRSISSRCGSADLMELAGAKLVSTEAEHQKNLATANITFLYAPEFHPALLHVRNARNTLGFRTLFNLLGPLLNPARAKKQVTGVYAAHWLHPVANVLANMQTESALVVCSQDGLDEISIVKPTEIVEYQAGTYKNWTLNPRDYGLSHANLDLVTIASPAESLQLILAVLDGAPGAARDMVLLNAAAAIYCAKPDISYETALQEAAHSIDSGAAKYCFNQLCNRS